MATSPQTNIAIPEIATFLLENDNYVICGHVSPDGDCMGSTLAMACILKALGKNVVTLIADDSRVDQAFSFLPGFESLEFAVDFHGKADTFINVDAAGENRIGKAAEAIRRKAKLSLTIDHHESYERSTNYAYIDPDAASCTLIIWEVAQAVRNACAEGAAHPGIDSDAIADIATCCYTGILTDTGRFMYQNTDAEAFALASEMLETGINSAKIASRIFQEKSLPAIKLEALAADRLQAICDGQAAISWITLSDIEETGAENYETEGCINVIRALKGSDVACMLKERNGFVKGSLRAKGSTDVSAIAREFNGGGHVAAAGFTLECSIEEAIEILKDRLSRMEFKGSER